VIPYLPVVSSLSLENRRTKRLLHQDSTPELTTYVIGIHKYTARASKNPIVDQGVIDLG